MKKKRILAVLCCLVAFSLMLTSFSIVSAKECYNASESDAEEYNEGDAVEPATSPAIYPDIIVNRPSSFPKFLKGTEGKIEYELPRAKGYEDIEVKGTVKFFPIDSDILKLDEDGNYKAIGEGKELLGFKITISDETQQEFREKYGMGLMVFEVAIAYEIYVTDGGNSNVVYRLYNPNSGEHFYSSTQSEIERIVAAGWKNEGVAWKAPAISGTPVYRLYNPNAGDHHYTMNADERENLVKAGWNYEGIGWCSDDAKGVELYRLYNPNAVAGSHHYTASEAEKETLVKAGWKDEGVAFYSK